MRSFKSYLNSPGRFDCFRRKWVKGTTWSRWSRGTFLVYRLVSGSRRFLAINKFDLCHYLEYFAQRTIRILSFEAIFSPLFVTKAVYRSSYSVRNLHEYGLDLLESIQV